MVAEVNKIIAGELLCHRSVVIPGVGTLYVAHRNARRLSRQKIAAPRNEVDFRPSEEDVSLVELIRRAGGCDEAQAQAIFDRWLAKTYEGGVLTLDGIGTLRHRAFTPEPAFAAQLNPQGEEVVTLQPRMNRVVVGIAVAAIAVALGVFGYIEFRPKSISRLVAQSEQTHTKTPAAERKNAPSESTVDGGISAAAAATDASPVAGKPAAEPAASPAKSNGSATVAHSGAEANGSAAAVHTQSEAAAVPQQASVPGPQAVQPAVVPQPASDRMQSGWCYVVFGVFSTEENAVRCREQLLRGESSLAVGVYPFGAKYMVAPFAAQDRAVCERFVREHRSTWPDLWIYAKK